jgi:hypothetical protein
MLGCSFLCLDAKKRTKEKSSIAFAQPLRQSKGCIKMLKMVFSAKRIETRPAAEASPMLRQSILS